MIALLMMFLLVDPPKQTKPPTYTTEPVTHQVAHCDRGWHLEQWHQPPYATLTTTNQHFPTAEGYSPAEPERFEVNPHPDICVMDNPPVSLGKDPQWDVDLRISFISNPDPVPFISSTYDSSGAVIECAVRKVTKVDGEASTFQIDCVRIKVTKTPLMKRGTNAIP